MQSRTKLVMSPSHHLAKQTLDFNVFSRFKLHEEENGDEEEHDVAGKRHFVVEPDRWCRSIEKRQ